MTNNTFRNDITIVGAGMIGLSLANLCARQGFRVALLERDNVTFTIPEKLSVAAQNVPKKPTDFDLRCFAISRATQKIFSTLNIWENLIENNANPYVGVTVWDGAGFGEINFNATEVSEPNLGHIIEQRCIMKHLWDITRAQENITVFSNLSPHLMTQEQDTATITLENGQILISKLVVGAEGAKSFVRKMSGIETKQESYHQEALIATLQTEYSHQNTAWQRFLPEGPLAFLPLSDPNFCTIVWTASPDTIQCNLKLTDTLFCESVAKAFDYRLGKVIYSSERKSFPLNMLHATHYVKPRVAIVGDAAHVIHPLAGQGVNLGMQDIVVLSEVLEQAKKRECDIGDILILRKYERARKGSVNRMIHGMKFFKELFGKRSEVVSVARSFGLNVTNKIPFLKRKFIREAMGI